MGKSRRRPRRAGRSKSERVVRVQGTEPRAPARCVRCGLSGALLECGALAKQACVVEPMFLNYMLENYES